MPMVFWARLKRKKLCRNPEYNWPHDYYCYYFICIPNLTIFGTLSTVTQAHVRFNLLHLRIDFNIICVCVHWRAVTHVYLWHLINWCFNSLRARLCVWSSRMGKKRAFAAIDHDCEMCMAFTYLWSQLWLLPLTTLWMMVI